MSDTTTPLPTVPPVPRPESGRHLVNVGHLVMGIAFLGLALVWSLVQADVVAGRDIRWLLPVPWVLAGGAGLAASAVAGARRHQVRHAQPQPQPELETHPRQEEQP